MDADTLKLLIQGGSFVVLAWVIHWLFTRTIPGIVDRFTETIDKQGETFSSEMDKQRQTTQQMLDRQQSMMDDTLRENTRATNEMTKTVASCRMVVDSRLPRAERG